ncbi:MAG: GNAT family N-acetyltransferase [Lachnospiraceae bacterium]|nr:GNAT family N-acetyltransferase [Lachnospiraceae bacterium]
MEEAVFPYKIRMAYKEEWEDAMSLAWKTFLRFEAQDYGAEGVKSFEDFITDHTLYRMFLMGVYQMFVAFYGDTMVGLISLRSDSHISLLFVDADHHRQGVGRALIDRLCEYLRTEMGISRVTVNASPYGVGFYHRLGFTDLGQEQVADGIRYTPMELQL